MNRTQSRVRLVRSQLPPPLACALLVTALAMFVWQCLAVGNFLVDDAFITFSFSKNLSLGNGPVYSHGLRAEGYSNFLWMVLVAVPLAIAPHLDPTLAARLVAVLFLGLLGWGTYRLTKLGTGSSTIAALGVLLLSCTTDVAIAYLSGLETVAYTALLVSSLTMLVASWRSTGEENGHGRARTLAPWFALAAALTRIDGFMAFGLVIGCELGHRLLTHRKLQPLALLRWAGPAVLTYLLWFGWRYWYYGLPLPSTYYAKALIPVLLPERGFTYVRDELISSGMFLAPLGAVWLLARGRGWAAVPLVAATAQLAYVMKVGGDWMPFGRFILPVIPLLLVLLLAGMVDAIGAVPRERRHARKVTFAAVLAITLVVTGRLDHRWWNDGVANSKLAGTREQTQHVNDLKRAAIFLNAVVPPAARLVTDYAGVLAYYTDAAVIDMWGLATPIIARRGGVEGVQPIYGRTCPECYPELDPEFFHVMVPLVRPAAAFKNADEVLANVWQTDTIGRHIDFRKEFAVGRAVDSKGGAAYFLEKRRSGFQPSARTVDALQIDYPFEPGAPRQQ